jgi:hypothetical protein
MIWDSSYDIDIYLARLQRGCRTYFSPAARRARAAMAHMIWDSSYDIGIYPVGLQRGCSEAAGGCRRLQEAAGRIFPLQPVE